MLKLLNEIPLQSPNKEFYNHEFHWVEKGTKFGLFIENTKEIGAFSYSINSNTLYIHYIVACKPGNGDGRKMVEHIMNLPNITTIEGGSSIDALGFWETLGAVFSEEDEEQDDGCYDTEPFVIHCI